MPAASANVSAGSATASVGTQRQGWFRQSSDRSIAGWAMTSSRRSPTSRMGSSLISIFHVTSGGDAGFGTEEAFDDVEGGIDAGADAGRGDDAAVVVEA